MDSLGDLIKTIPAVKLVRCWKESVGPVIWEQTVFLGVKRNKAGKNAVYIQVNDPLWKQELHYQQKDILERFRAKMLENSFSRNNLPQTIEFFSKRSF